ncbi:bcl-2-related ovarian killer protein homolog B-like isoform X2 [Adelges cooleyi]|nr:bcl-2-related ovarian killer protein homolog B-like isoform X2 [Adelges cooleyi]XP_050430996.1 bcl-2-related ovarian killer protein homolog B-like isoform X2 [Adelges cooleyi]
MSEGGLIMSSWTASTSRTVPRRKFSIPVALSSAVSHQLSANTVDGTSSLAVATARRRLSNVSDVVSRKLSHTIGWRTAVPAEQIACQGKALCSQYVRWKLKRAGAFTKKCGLLRMRSINSLPQSAGVRDVFPAVLTVGQELERLHPKLYTAGPTRQARSAAAVLVSVSRELFRPGTQITWAKVVSLMCVAAGLAVDTVRQGHAEQLSDIIEAVGEVIEDDLAAWIHYNGGWIGLQTYCRPANVENSVSSSILSLATLLIVLILFLLLLRWLKNVALFR